MITSTDGKLQNFLHALEVQGCNPRQSGKGWIARCLCHDDRSASLSVGIGDDGRILIHCFAGCETESIVKAAGFKMADLMSDDGSRKQAKQAAKIVQAYDYRDADGSLLFQVVRFEPKDFRQRKPKPGGGWDWKVAGIRQVPFCLPEIVKRTDETAFIVEGEKDALALLNRHGVLATCNAGGASKNSDKCKWTSEHAAYLAGRDVVILPDNDEAGRGHAQGVARSLVGVAKSIKVLELPGLPPKGDVSDWLASGGTAAELRRLAYEAAEWVPTAEPEKSSSTRGPRIRVASDEKHFYSIEVESGRTDAANAHRFVSSFGEVIAYVPEWRRWLAWDGRRWKDDNGVGVMRAAKEYAESLWLEFAELAKVLDREELGPLQTFCKSTNQTPKIQSFLKLAESDSRIVSSADDWNRNNLLLNVENGTVDLETGQLRPHDPADKITHVAAVAFDPAAQCPEWEAALQLIFAADAELIRFVQQLLGYSCSGLTIEEVLILCWGDGGNGKSTIWNTIGDLLGDYARSATQDLILPEKSQHPEIIAKLRGKRFVTISEPEGGRELRESTAKMLSSTDRIEAREMFGDRYEFKPTHKIWIPTNHKPRIKGVDTGIWRRIKMIPFLVEIKKLIQPRKGFHDWLVANEGPGILNWMIRGFQDYRANGLIEPRAVVDATEEYKQESDSLGEFLRDYCTEEHGATVLASDLFQVYQAEFGGKWSKTAFGKKMVERFDRVRGTSGEHRNKWLYCGLRLATEADCAELRRVGNKSLGICANSIGALAEVGATRRTDDPTPKPCPKCGRPMELRTFAFGSLWDCSPCQYDEPAEAQTTQGAV